MGRDGIEPPMLTRKGPGLQPGAFAALPPTLKTPVRLERTITGLQPVALPVWLWRHLI